MPGLPAVRSQRSSKTVPVLAAASCSARSSASCFGFSSSSPPSGSSGRCEAAPSTLKTPASTTSCTGDLGTGRAS